VQITFYGTGSSTPSPKVENKPFRSFSGWFVEISSDSLLFDVGSGVLHKMLEDKVDIVKKPTHLFISHFHIDHFADLMQLMQTRKVASKDKNDSSILNLIGPHGVNEIFEILLGIEKIADPAYEIRKPELFEVKEMGEDFTFETNEWKVTSSPIKHFNGNCYRLDSNGKSVIYSGDMGYDERICELGKNADLAILECSYPDSRSDLHLGPMEIGKLAKLGNFKKVVLTHMYPACAGREEEVSNTIKKIAGCEVIIPQDSQKLEI